MNKYKFHAPIAAHMVPRMGRDRAPGIWSYGLAAFHSSSAPGAVAVTFHRFVTKVDVISCLLEIADLLKAIFCPSIFVNRK